MRIIAGAWRGRRLVAPAGHATRPTADRLRQALFDMLLHAPWAGPDALVGARVLDVFAGSGTLGLEALSRGAAHATFVEHAPPALAALRANVAALGANATMLAADALAPPRAPAAATLVFLDPPYRQALIPSALAALAARGWLAPDALVIAETARDEPALTDAPLTERAHGAGRLTAWRRETSDVAEVERF